jgi:hypothetical protein
MEVDIRYMYELQLQVEVEVHRRCSRADSGVLRAEYPTLAIEVLARKK